MHRFDIALLSDFRFPGGTSAAVAEEVRAAHGAGYSVGLIALEAANLTTPLALNPRLRALVETGACTLVPPREPVEARLAQLHNPYAAVLLPWESVRLRAEQRMVVVQHPPTEADGKPYYDLAQVRRNAEEILGGSALWAPVGPLVRQQLDRARQPPEPDQRRLAQCRGNRALAYRSSRSARRPGGHRSPQPA